MRSIVQIAPLPQGIQSGKYSQTGRVRGLKSFFSERLHQFMIARLLLLSATTNTPLNTASCQSRIYEAGESYPPDPAHRQNQKFLVIIYAFLNRGKIHQFE